MEIEIVLALRDGNTFTLTAPVGDSIVHMLDRSKVVHLTINALGGKRLLQSHPLP